MNTLVELAAMPQDTLRRLSLVLTDIDDTLTLHGRLPPQAYEALHEIRAAGVKVIPVTGRPAGWCDHIARMWPVDAVVGENGAFYFLYDDAKRKMVRHYAQGAETRTANQQRLWQIARDVLAKYPGTAIATDQAYREIDVAIDFCEDVPPLPLDTAQRIADEFITQGCVAKVSSIHVNAWIGNHDKLSMSLALLQKEFGVDAQQAKQVVAYCGDSPNDAPMFAYFPVSIGVANIKPLLSLTPHHPGYLTIGEGGIGFAEFADAILAIRR